MALLFKEVFLHSRVRSIVAAGGVAAGLLLAACSSGGSGSVPYQTGHQEQPNGKIVAVFGDSQQQLESRIGDATKAGLTPRYVVVRAQVATYKFPVYAQILRSDKALIVRSYNRAFVFPLATTHVQYSGLSGDEPASAIPHVSAAYFDKLVMSGRAPGQYEYGNVSSKKKLCIDCVAIVAQKNRLTSLMANFNGLRDRWQINPEYVAWAPQPTNVTMAYGPCGSGTSSSVIRRQASEPPGYGGGTSSSGTVKKLVAGNKVAMSAGCSGLSVPSFNSGPSTVVSRPAPKPSPNWCTTTSVAAANSAIQKSALLQSTMRALAAAGSPVNIVEDDSLKAGTAAQYNSATGQIQVDSSNFNAAVASGQDPTQILFHEMDHQFDDLSTVSVNPGNSATVTINGYTISYDFTQPASPTGVTASDAYWHALVHNDIQQEFGTDNTGAIDQAFGDYLGLGMAPGVTVKDSSGKAVSGSTAVATAAQNSKSKAGTPSADQNNKIAKAITNAPATCPANKATASRRAQATVSGFATNFTIGAIYSTTPIATLTPTPTATPVPTPVHTATPAPTPVPTPIRTVPPIHTPIPRPIGGGGGIIYNARPASTPHPAVTP